MGKKRSIIRKLQEDFWDSLGIEKSVKRTKYATKNKWVLKTGQMG
jgi:hypothetical protein